MSSKEQALLSLIVAELEKMTQAQERLQEALAYQTDCVRKMTDAIKARVAGMERPNP